MLVAPIFLSKSVANRNNKGSMAYSAIHSLFTQFLYSLNYHNRIQKDYYSWVYIKNSGNWKIYYIYIPNYSEACEVKLIGLIYRRA